VPFWPMATRRTPCPARRSPCPAAAAPACSGATGSRRRGWLRP
jgi:hypothetical protein